MAQRGTTRQAGRSARPNPQTRKPRPSRARVERRPVRRVPKRAPRYRAADYRTAAAQRLRRFRRHSQLAVALTGLILIMWGAADVPAQETAGAVADTIADTLAAAADTLAPAPDAGKAMEEAATTARDLALGFYALLPKLAVAVLVLILAAVLTKVVRPMLRRLLASFSRAEAISALAGIGIWLIALGAALSIMAGDARALVGSVGLFGLALSWALQAPIESFTGWLLNSFRGYYRVGDRILVGDVFGDVWRIDFLTTTVWEAGGPGKSVQGAQPTGALITFPNSEILRSNVTNFTRMFPYVWDEIVIGVTNETDLRYALSVIRNVAERTFGDTMREPARVYVGLLEQAGLGFDIATEPQLFVSPTEAWMDITVRYLVPARERRRWASELQLALHLELAREEHRPRIESASPLTRILLQPIAGMADGSTATPV